MNKKVVEFIKKHRISVLSTILTGGTPHSASMHYATSDSTFIFFTKDQSRKCHHFDIGKKYPASLVVGFSEEEWVEFQSEGFIEKIDRAKSKLEVKIFAEKFDGAKLDEEHVVLKYKPTWWRYTEFKPKFYSVESKSQ